MPINPDVFLPTDIKKAATALIISCCASLVAVYFDGLEIADAGFDNPLVFGINIVWIFVIAWIIWDLLKGKDIKVTLILVGAIILASVAWGISESGFTKSQIFYMVELAMFVIAYFFVSSNASKSWYATKSK